MTGPWRYWVASGLFVGAIILGLQLHKDPARGRELSFTLIAGFAAGLAFQRTQFCFASAFRDFFRERERRVLIGLIIALAVGSAGYMIVFGARFPEPSLYPPDTAHIAPIGYHLAFGGALFGFGMVVGGGCITGHLFRLGEGSAVALVGLAGVVIGYAMGLSVWNWVYLNLVSSTEIWLPQRFGYAIPFAIQTVVLAVAAALVIDFTPARAPEAWAPSTLFVVGRRLFIEKWPGWAGGLVIGLIATFTYLRTYPLGVTEEIGRIARVGGDAVGILPASLHRLDKIRGCAAVTNPGQISTNAIFVLAFVGGSFFAALLAADFRPRWGSAGKVARTFGGGLLVGFGAMISLGCTVGTLMSGIMAFSVSGWIFLAALTGGAWAGAKVLGRP